MAHRFPESARTRVGGALVGPYRTVKPLGSGGMANVLEAVDTRTGDVVALKLLHADTAAHSEAVARFTREARALHNLKHPNIVQVFDHGITEEGDAWIAMELLRGCTLKELIRAKGQLKPARAVRLVIDIAKALATVHARGLIHRDIKPENVFVVGRGTSDEHAKLIDFGVARVTEAELGEHSVQYTQVGKMLGSAAFMAPEQNSGDVDGRADVFALGITLYEALTNALPFDGRTAEAQLEARSKGAIVPLAKRAKGATFHPELEGLLRTMLAADRTQRPAGALAVLQALNALLPKLEPSVDPRSSSPSLAKPTSGRLSVSPEAGTLRAGGEVGTPSLGPASPAPDAASAQAMRMLKILVLVLVVATIALGIVTFFRLRAGAP